MATRYWVLGTGTFNTTNTANFAAISGAAVSDGLGFASTDDIVFDSGSGSGFTVTIAATGPTIRNLTITGVSGMTLAGAVAWAFQGNLDLPATGLTWSANGTCAVTGSANSTLMTRGVTIGCIINTNKSGGASVTLLDALILGSTRNLVVTAGVFDAGVYAVTCQNVSSNNTNARTLNGSGNWTVMGSGGSAFNLGGSNLTTGLSAANIIMSAATAKTFSGLGKTFGKLTQGGAGILTVAGTGTTLNDIGNTTQPATIRFTAGETFNIVAWSLAGTAGNLITVNSTDIVTPVIATLSKPSGTVTANYTSIQAITATGGATWNASNGTNTDAGSNTNWIFTSGSSYPIAGSGSGSATGATAAIKRTFYFTGSGGGSATGAAGSITSITPIYFGGTGGGSATGATANIILGNATRPIAGSGSGSATGSATFTGSSVVTSGGGPFLIFKRRRRI